MKTVSTARPIPLSLTAIVAFFSALAALAVSGGMAHAHGGGHEHGEHARIASSPLLTKKSVALHEDMRKLWEDHITWTRLAIISLEGGTPDTAATVDRLLKNQTDIGDAMQPFFGETGGARLTALLREHILIAADLIAAAKAGDDRAVADAQARWTQNADAIAAHLHSLNPRYWPLQALKNEMHMHLALTTREAVAHLEGDWTGDVAAYDDVHRHILGMSDGLADGLVKQFRSRFS